MTNLEFRYWLSGYLSLSDDIILNKEQLTIIKKHADLAAELSGQIDLDILNFFTQIDSESDNNTINFLSFKLLAKAILNI